MRRKHQIVPARQKLRAQEVLNLFANDAAFGVPEDQARPGLVLDAEQIQILAEAPMVAPLRLLELVEVSVELFLAEEGRSVDALERVRVLVALPVRARDAQQFYRLDAAGRWDVRAAAEVQELARAVGGEDRLGLFFDELALQKFALLAKELQSFIFGETNALVGEVVVNEFAHLLLNLCQVRLGEGLLAKEIIKETGSGGRADARVSVGKELQHGGGEQVRRRVPVDFQSLGRVRSDELNRSALVEW